MTLVPVPLTVVSFEASCDDCDAAELTRLRLVGVTMPSNVPASLPLSDRDDMVKLTEYMRLNTRYIWHL